MRPLNASDFPTLGARHTPIAAEPQCVPHHALPEIPECPDDEHSHRASLTAAPRFPYDTGKSLSTDVNALIA